MSKLLNYSTNALLSVTDTKVAEINPIIFQTKLLPSLAGLTKFKGKHYALDTRSNTSVLITNKSIRKGAIKAIEKGRDTTGYLKIAEDFNLIQEVTLKRDETVEGNCDFGCALEDLLDDLKFKVTKVKVMPQNSVVFNTVGVEHISNLTKHKKSLYVLDTRNNAATLVNPERIAEQAVKDLLKGKTTDYTILSDQFNLITSITLTRKA